MLSGRNYKLIRKTLMGSKQSAVLNNISWPTEHDIYLFKQGRHFRLYEKLGAHLIEHAEMNGVFFAVWAPTAAQVSVIRDFDKWKPQAHALIHGEIAPVLAEYVKDMGSTPVEFLRVMEHPFYGKYDQSLSTALPPLGIIIFKPDGGQAA
jgi:1,4-alpha-glucan branching enzyme